MASPVVEPGSTSPGKGQPMVRVTGLSKSYRTEASEPIHACRDIDFEMDGGEIVAVMGPSGSGKSTLLHLIGALDTPDSGTIEVAGESVTGVKGRRLAEHRRRIGFVFQRFHLLPTLTAADNVIAPLLPYKVGFDKRAKAKQLLGAVGLTGREDSLPSKLSGGQQQRVAIARALVNDPMLVLADEPTGNLDSQTGNEIIDLLFGLRDRLGTSLMIATHDPGLAARCGRVVQVRDGRITEDTGA
ncbi:ABC transporter ATP-binding protein [Solwaraspora sp. WMMB762]|uniref:ABC transporter ATP-binding protein n=1 Tax=Solwaraspora sp. WMMB762 TaxID=3404120 RepID=UPI003B93DDD8